MQPATTVRTGIGLLRRGLQRQGLSASGAYDGAVPDDAAYMAPRERRRVLLAAPRGYCAGVDRAVITVEKALELYGAAGLRPQADRAQQARRRDPGGRAARSSSRRPTRCPRARPSSSPRTASRRSCTRRPARRSLRTIDATCPLVTKVHHEARRFAADDYRHPADRPRGPRGGRRHHRRGARAHHPGRRAGRRRGTSRSRDPTKVAWLSQTTLSVDETHGDGATRCASGFPLLLDPPSDDICYATQNRQVAVKEIAADCRPGHRRRVDQLLELGAAGRGGPRGRRRATAVAGRQGGRDRRRLARRASRRSA